MSLNSFGSQKALSEQLAECLLIVPAGSCALRKWYGGGQGVCSPLLVISSVAAVESVLQLSFTLTSMYKARVRLASLIPLPVA